MEKLIATDESKVIISHLIGGLGNQMFQYAAGRALSLRLGLPLKLDLSSFAGYRLHHGYQLMDVFACQPSVASREDVRTLLGWREYLLVRRLLSRPCLAFLRSERLIIEPHFHCWPGIVNITGNCYLQGYWQSERYFADASAVIRADFAFREPLVGRNAELVTRIVRKEAVSLHIRRGDYVSDPKTRAVLELCSLDYYRAAVRHIAKRIASPEFFVFSDDIAWARENLDLGFPCVYIDHNCGIDSYKDMHLMSLCRHHILANSSFSWWGAWLNPRPDKIIVAPARWFANDFNAADLVPAAWVRL